MVYCFGRTTKSSISLDFDLNQREISRRRWPAVVWKRSQDSVEIPLLEKAADELSFVISSLATRASWRRVWRGLSTQHCSRPILCWGSISGAGSCEARAGDTTDAHPDRQCKFCVFWVLVAGCEVAKYSEYDWWRTQLIKCDPIAGIGSNNAPLRQYRLVFP